MDGEDSGVSVWMARIVGFQCGCRDQCGCRGLWGISVDGEFHCGWRG